MDFVHKSVLLEECIEGLKIKEDGIYVDGTLGGAGHSSEIVKKLSSKGKLIGIDRDTDALKAAKEKLKEFENVTYYHGNHDNIKEILSDLKIEQVDGILLDLGVSSYQLDEKNRGFSYLGENILDMRMDKTQKLDAKFVVNNYKEEELAKIIFEYGEERFSRSIAKNICAERKTKEITTTKQLVEIIEKSIPAKFKNKDSHPAKRTFQAIRIEVNDEIKPLYNTVIDSIDCLKPGGRLCIITFHSLEDRAVKNAYNDSEGKCICPPGLPYCACGAINKGKNITKKPIIPTKEEMNENSRSKSAKLRIFEKNKKGGAFDLAMQRYNKYQYETSPRKLEPEYRTPNKKYPKKSTAPKVTKQVKKEKVAQGNNVRKRDRAKLVIALGLVFSAIFAISYRNSQIDESFTKNEEMKQQYLSIEKENDQMKVDIENNLNLNNVEQQAKELLGMQRLSNKQTVYISLPKKDYIQPAAESVIIEEDDGIISKIINKIKKIF